MFASSNCENFWLAVLNYSSERFGEIAVAIATTFYVVFTYRLLENSEAQRKHSTEPHLLVQWHQSAKRTDAQLSNMKLFAEDTRNLLIESFAFGTDAIDEASMATGNRYLILQLSNVRDKPIGRITLAVSGTLEIPGISMGTKLTDKLRLHDLQIGSSEKVEVTMVDLFPIPQTANVTIVIEAIAYEPIDGGAVLNEFSGEKQRSVPGEFVLGSPKDPQPD